MSSDKRYDWAQDASEKNSVLVINKIKLVYPNLMGDEFDKKVSELCAHKFEDINWPE